MKAAEIKFLGAARQVTGSSYLLTAGGMKILIDCGLYQERKFLERNWRPLPFPASEVDLVLLTHAHLDHCGLLPKLTREGFHGPIMTTRATADLLSISLMDSARIQEEDAAFKKKRHKKEGRSGPHRELPLYAAENVLKTLPLIHEIAYDEPLEINESVTARFRDAGHILGSAMLEIEIRRGNGQEPLRVVFSGDIGLKGKPFVRDPHVFETADYIIMESTYGDRDHLDPAEPTEILAEVIQTTAEAGGKIIIPTFAIERAQDLLFYLSRLVRRGIIKGVPVYLDSPMAHEVTKVFDQHGECLDEESQSLFRAGKSPFSFPGFHYVSSVEESKSLNELRTPAVIMAGSGMCTGGRVKHHLTHNLSRPESTVLFVGYQAQGTLGRRILDKESSVRVHGLNIPVRARVEIINGFSAHADRKGLTRWLENLEAPPRSVFICHGDEDVSLNFAGHVREITGWQVKVPYYLQTIDLY